MRLLARHAPDTLEGLRDTSNVLTCTRLEGLQCTLWHSTCGTLEALWVSDPESC